MSDNELLLLGAAGLYMLSKSKKKPTAPASADPGASTGLTSAQADQTIGLINDFAHVFDDQGGQPSAPSDLGDYDYGSGTGLDTGSLDDTGSDFGDDSGLSLDDAGALS